MKPCRRVGLDVTWRCNERCAHCFYRHGGNEFGELGTPWDAPLDTLLAKVDKGRARGLNHVVLEGFGEPLLMRTLDQLLLACKERGMTTSIITNGTIIGSGSNPFARYEKCYREWGLDHLHISSHGFGHTLDEITQLKGAGEKQLRLKQWLKAEGLPFRTNITLQQINYQQIPEIIAQDVELGSFHCVMLGFIPLYEWRDPRKTQEVGVHPAKLRPYIERAARFLKDRNHLFTIRYHPHCHLDPEFWPYIVNARYVFLDPFEWNYALQADDIPALWEASKKMGDSVAVKDPCHRCSAYRHCGGWNIGNVQGTGAVHDLQPISFPSGVPAIYHSLWHTDGGLHDLNPVNHLDGITPPFIRDSRREAPATTPSSLSPPTDEVIEEEYIRDTTEPAPAEKASSSGMSLPLVS